jgi:hypothetical protein
MQLKKQWCSSRPTCELLEQQRRALMELDVDELYHGALAETGIGQRASRVFESEPGLLMQLRKVALAELVQKERKRELLEAERLPAKSTCWAPILSYLRKPTLLDEALNLHPDAFEHFKRMLRVLVDDEALQETIEHERALVLDTVDELYRCCTPIQIVSLAKRGGVCPQKANSLGYDIIPMSRLEAALRYLERYRGREHDDHRPGTVVIEPNRIEAPRKADGSTEGYASTTKEERKSWQICHDALGISQYSQELLRSYVNEWYERPLANRDALEQVVLLEISRGGLQDELQKAIVSHAEERLECRARILELFNRFDFAALREELSPGHVNEPNFVSEKPETGLSTAWYLDFAMDYIQALHELTLDACGSRLISLASLSPTLYALFRRLVRFLVLAEYEQELDTEETSAWQRKMRERFPSELHLSLASAACTRISGKTSFLATRIESDLELRRAWLAKSALCPDQPLPHEHFLPMNELEQPNIFEWPIMDERQLDKAVLPSHMPLLHWLHEQLIRLFGDNQILSDVLATDVCRSLPSQETNESNRTASQSSDATAGIDEELVSLIMEFTDVTRAGAIFILREYMRQNPGGRLSSAQEILDRLFP